MMRSDEPYEISDDALDEVLKRVAQSRAMIDPTQVIYFSHEECKKILMPLARFVDNGKYGLGALDILPNELIQDILTEHIDFESLVYVRQVNRCARRFVQLMPKYQAVVKSSLQLIPALLRTSVSKKFTLQDMFQLLRTPGCGICHDRHAILVYVPRLMRICTDCAYRNESKSIRMIRVTDACKLVGIRSDQLGKIGTKRGSNAGLNRSFFKRGIISWKLVKEALWTQCTKAPEVLGPLLSSFVSNIHRFDVTQLACCSFPVTYDFRRSRISHTVVCEGCVKLEHARTRGSSSKNFTSSARENVSVYYEHEFLLHFRWCRPAQILYQVSDEKKSSRIAELLNRSRWCGRFAANAGPHIKEIKRQRMLATVVHYRFEQRMIELGLLQRAG